MKKLISRIGIALLATAVIGAVASCEEETPQDLKIDVDNLSVTLPAEGGSVSVKAEIPLAWSVETTESWFSVSPSSGEKGSYDVVFSAEKNETGATRSGKATIKAEGIDGVTLSVTQPSVEIVTPPDPPTPPTPDPVLSLSLDKIEMAAEGGATRLTVTSNTKWTVTASATWITVSPASGENDGVVSVAIAENTENSSREGSLVFSYGNASASVTVVQAGITPVITLAYTTLSAPAAGGSHALSLRSNVPWQASSGASWLTLSPSNGGAGDFTITLSVEANSSSDPRTVSVNFSGSGASATLTVTQEGKKADDAGFDGSVNDWEEGGELEFNETTIY